MPDYIHEVFQRMSLQQIRSFLLCGADDLVTPSQSYHDTLKTESAAIYERLADLCPNEASLDAATANLTQALTAYETVYMEIGMKAGARLVWQLLGENDQCPTERGDLR